jgi:regulatory protein
MTRLRSRNRLLLKNSDPSTPERAYQYALRLLTARDYTEMRLREKLRGREFGEPDIEAALERMTSEGWLDDRRFAERFAESALASGRYYGPRLRQEMRRRGLPPELVAEVLGRIMEEHDECQDMSLVFERRFSGFSFASASDKEKHRVIGFLQRRGFGFSAIMQFLRGAER